jgi:hypothetical protein
MLMYHIHRLNNDFIQNFYSDKNITGRNHFCSQYERRVISKPVLNRYWLWGHEMDWSASRLGVPWSSFEFHSDREVLEQLNNLTSWYREVSQSINQRDRTGQRKLKNTQTYRYITQVDEGWIHRYTNKRDKQGMDSALSSCQFMHVLFKHIHSSW